jgi:hypothetical protein
MEHRIVQQGTRQATWDRTELRIRSRQATSVHDSPLRTVTSLVTSPAGGCAGLKHTGPARPASLGTSPHCTSLARDPAPRCCTPARLAEPPASDMGSPAHPGSARSCPAPRDRQCTPGSRDRTAGARTAARPEPLPRRDLPGSTALAHTSNPATSRRDPLPHGTACGPARADRTLRPAAARSRGHRSGRPG